MFILFLGIFVAFWCGSFFIIRFHVCSRWIFDAGIPYHLLEHRIKLKSQQKKLNNQKKYVLLSNHQAPRRIKLRAESSQQNLRC